MISTSISSYYQSTYTLTPHIDRIEKSGRYLSCGKVLLCNKFNHNHSSISLSSTVYPHPFPLYTISSINQPKKMSSSTSPSQPKKFTLHFLQASRSIRTAWHLEILQIPYEVKFSPRTGNNGPAPLEFKEAAGGLGKFPTLEVEYEGNGGNGGEKHREFLYESGNICEYVLDLSLSLFPSFRSREEKIKKKYKEKKTPVFYI